MQCNAIQLHLNSNFDYDDFWKKQESITSLFVPKQSKFNCSDWFILHASLCSALSFHMKKKKQNQINTIAMRNIFTCFKTIHMNGILSWMIFIFQNVKKKEFHYFNKLSTMVCTQMDYNFFKKNYLLKWKTTKTVSIMDKWSQLSTIYYNSVCSAHDEPIKLII